MINMNEEAFYEGGPAKSDLIINLLAGITILGLPFTFAAIVRALWLRYKITNKRITNPKRSGLYQFHSYGQPKGLSVSSYLGSWTIVID